MERIDTADGSFRRVTGVGRGDRDGQPLGTLERVLSEEHRKWHDATIQGFVACGPHEPAGAESGEIFCPDFLSDWIERAVSIHLALSNLHLAYGALREGAREEIGGNADRIGNHRGVVAQFISGGIKPRQRNWLTIHPDFGFDRLCRLEASAARRVERKVRDWRSGRRPGQWRAFFEIVLLVGEERDRQRREVLPVQRQKERHRLAPRNQRHVGGGTG